MTTIAPPETPLRERRFSREIAEARMQADVLERLFHHDVDAPGAATSWSFTPPAGLTDDEKVAAARTWLASHRHAFLSVARDLGHTGPAEKIDTDTHVGVGVWIGDRSDIWAPKAWLRATVPTEVTCEMVDTGEVRTIPATPERTEPVLERRCPESLFRSVADDAITQAVSA